ncbi:MAG: NDP-sugar synthase, partial [Bacteroidota bacterium]
FLTGNLPFIVMNVDILTTLDISTMYQAHLDHKALATLAITNRASSRGFLYNKERQLIGWKNNTTGETKISIDTNEPILGSFSGIHIIDPKIFELTHRTGKFSIVDQYLDLAAHYPIFVYDHTGDTVIDVGKPESIEKAEQFFT